MSKTERTDPHRPSALNPADYVYVGAADNHPGASWFTIDYDRLRKYGVEIEGEGIERVPFYDARADGRPNFRCHTCGKHGSNIHYFCFFLHKPTKEVVVFGQICAQKAELASREELDFQKSVAYRKQAKLLRWKKDHEAEYAFLREYSEQHAESGWYSEFFASLWEKVHEWGYLTDRQSAALRRWMERGKPWEAVKTTEKAKDPDRHKGEVTHTDEPPTEAQASFITKLSEELGIDAVIPETRLAASDHINSLKAKLLNQREQHVSRATLALAGFATSRQLSYINALMDERKMTLEARRAARQKLDAGLTREQASRWIERLRELPKVGEE